MLFRFEGIARVTESNVPLISLSFSLSLSLSLSLYLSLLRPFCNNEVYSRHVFRPWPAIQEKASKKTITKLHPRYCQIYIRSEDSKIRRSARCRHASMIKLNNIYATREQCIPSIVLDISVLFVMLYFFPFSLWGRRLHGFKTRSKWNTKWNAK